MSTAKSISVNALLCLLTVFVSTSVLATSGHMPLTSDTTLAEDHFGTIALAADNITLDCDGFTVTASPGDGAAIGIDSRDGGTVQNCIVMANGATRGLLIQFSNDNSVLNNTFDGASFAGINLNSTDRNLVDGNVILNNGDHGVSISNSVDNVFVDNVITGNSDTGVLLGTVRPGNLFEANTITDNGLNGGIRVSVGAGHEFRSNFIFDNDGRGIQLLGGGAVNDPLDTDMGPNDLQNYPDLATVVAGDSAVIGGTLHSTPSTTFRLEFFANSVCHTGGLGEGEIPLGTFDVSTDVSGDAPFVATLGAGISAGTLVTSTATNPNFSTSEFSACLAAISPQALLDPIVDDVQALIDSGDLNQGQGNSLIKKLQNASGKLDAGNTKAALGILNAFVNQVSAFVNTGTISAEDGQALIDAVNVVIASLA